MPVVRQPVRRSGVRYTSRPGRVYRPPTARPQQAKKSGLMGLIGGLGGLLLCLLCLSTLGLLGLFATFIPIVKYLSDINSTFGRLTGAGGSIANFAYNLNMVALLVALCFASIRKLIR